MFLLLFISALEEGNIDLAYDTLNAWYYYIKAFKAQGHSFIEFDIGVEVEGILDDCALALSKLTHQIQNNLFFCLIFLILIVILKNTFVV